MKELSRLEEACQAVPEDQIRQAMLDVIQHAVRFQLNTPGTAAEGIVTLEAYLQGDVTLAELQDEHTRIGRAVGNTYLVTGIWNSLIPDSQLSWSQLWLVCRFMSCYLARIEHRGTQYPDASEEDWQVAHLETYRKKG